MRVQAGAVAAGVILLGLLVDAGGGEDYGIGADQVRTLDLADVVGGGDGTGTGADAGIRMLDGRATTSHRNDDLGPTRNRFVAALDLPFIDGVSVPDGGEDGSLAVPVSSTGLTATGLVTPATSDGGTWDDLWNGANVDVVSAVDGAAAIGAHANKGVTFDLAAIEDAHPGFEVDQFVARAHLGDRAGRSDEEARFYVALDGQVEAAVSLDAVDDSEPVAVAIETDTRFLTLVTVSGTPGGAALWSRPLLVLRRTNQRPIARFVAPTHVRAGVNLVLDGSNSRDPEGTDLTYRWTVNDVVVGNGPSPSVGLERGLYLPIGDNAIELVVNDGEQDSLPVRRIVQIDEDLEFIVRSALLVDREDPDRPGVSPFDSFSGTFRMKRVEETGLARVDLSRDPVEPLTFLVGNPGAEVRLEPLVPFGRWRNHGKYGHVRTFRTNPGIVPKMWVRLDYRRAKIRVRFSRFAFPEPPTENAHVVISGPFIYESATPRWERVSDTKLRARRSTRSLTATGGRGAR